MAKRRLISQLPVVHQTKTLQKFFNATVDQVFQPGETQSINAFVGRKPSYFDAKKDFYKTEVTDERSFYQLEPAMTTRNSDGSYEDLLFYTDVVNQLRFQGANVSDHSRLFDTEIYSWCPPVNVDKLSSHRDYYWLPDGPPTLIITMPYTSYQVENDNLLFKLPRAIEGLNEDIVVKVNGVQISQFNILDGGDFDDVSSDIVDGGEIDVSNSDSDLIDGNLDEGYSITEDGEFIEFTGSLEVGSLVQIWRHGNFKQNIIGKTSYKHPRSAYGTVSQTIQTTTGLVKKTYGPTRIETPPALLPGMHLAISDNNGLTNWEVRVDSDDKLYLVTPEQHRIFQMEPQYFTIERNANNLNQWSRGNHWYHKDLLFFGAADLSPTQAQRPIIEFNRDLQLFNHGDNKLPDVNMVWDDASASPYDLMLTNVSQVDWKGVDFPSTRSIIPVRILVQNSNDPAINGKILTADINVEPMLWSDISSQPGYESNWDTPEASYWETGADITFKDVLDVQAGDCVILAEDAVDSWWFNGTEWAIQQQNKYPQAPLFQLYDNQGIKLDAWEGSNFQGSKLFAYTEGTTYDSILGINVKRNKHGSLDFTDHVNSDVFTHTNGTFKGFQYYARVRNGVTTQHSTWNPAGKSIQKKRDGFYEIPLNLQANPLNQNVTNISANEWNKQFKELRNNNNWLLDSDRYDLSLGRSIVQHRSGMLKTMLMSSNASLDFQKATLYSEREYLRFRGKFGQTLTSFAQANAIGNPQDTLMLLLTQLRSAKTPDFPFANNGVIGDYYIPATGAYLGMTPLWFPHIFEENNILLIRGHDGSLTRSSAVRDAETGILTPTKRDEVMLALEMAIYTSASESLRKRRRPVFDLVPYIPGKFRKNTEYSRDEMLTIARPMFERWAAQNGKQYRENVIYDANNPFTYNYRSVLDVNGDVLPGYWRGIYKHYYDTDRPHTHAWEMLGYTSKPTLDTVGWDWDAHYSWTDSAKRGELIRAIVFGIVDPITERRDPAYERLDFESFIPVNDDGSLRNPIQAGIVRDVNVQDYSAPWEFGDYAPEEHTWWNSFAASFTLAQLCYLMKPCRFVESNWVMGDEFLANDHQWISANTGTREHNPQAFVHNEIVNNKAMKVLGLQTWLSDHIRSQGANVTTTLGEKVRSLGANIAHKLGGFIDASSLKTFTENSGLIPQEDANLALYRSPSIREEFYGGVIIERSQFGWRVLGYNVVDPVFNIHPVKPTGRRIKLSLDDSVDASIDWHADTYYQVGVLVLYKNTNYRCNKTHTSGRAFEQSYWTAESVGRQMPSGTVTWYGEHDTDVVERISYGTEFTTRQELSDFLSGYQAYLEGRGWVFDQYEASINRMKDFEYSMLEFMYWSQANWTPGTFITLSPAAESIKFTAKHGTVQNVEQLVNGVYSLLDKQGSAIPSSTVTVNRLDHEITIGVTEGGIYGSRVFVSEVEQAVIFNNKTIFQDVIYEPLFNLRQNRIRLIGLLSTGWEGKLDAPGFVITDNRLVPSFERQVEDIRHMYDIEQPINLPLRDNARHQVGYQGREYLENLMYNDVNQFEFYQGMIQQKGAPGVFKKLLRNEELTQTRNLSFLEEWAFRKGAYGGTELRSTFELVLQKQDVKQEPQIVETLKGSWDRFSWEGNHKWDAITPQQLTHLDTDEDTTITLFQDGDTWDSRWVVPPKGDLFKAEDQYAKVKGSLPTPGYVRITETNWQAMDLMSLNNQIINGQKDIEVGERVWLYKDGKGSWNVYRSLNATLDNTPNTIMAFTPYSSTDGSLNFGTTITFEKPTSFQVGDLLYIEKNVQVDSEELVGAHVIVKVIDSMTVQLAVDTLNAVDYPLVEGTVSGPQVTKLESVRFNGDDQNIEEYSKIIRRPKLQDTDLAILNISLNNYQNGEIIYVDVAYENATQHLLDGKFQRWATFTKVDGEFVRTRLQPKRIRRDLIADVKVFESFSVRTDKTLDAKPLIFGDILTYDPLNGLISGSAEKEIFYKVEHDPAYYTAGATVSRGLEWGSEQVGRLWWDLSTTRFLTAETNNELDTSERLYRMAHWGKLAPGSSVDIWEWTKSYVSPTDWQSNYEKGKEPRVYDGEILNASNPSWVEDQEWDEQLSKYVPVYFFWVKNRKNTPEQMEARSISASDVANIISNPLGSGIAWVAPIATNMFIFNGLAQFLTSTSTIQFTVAQSSSDTQQHVEWEMMREGDDRSLPSQYLWEKMVTSLTARDMWGNVVPDTKRYHTDRVGFDVERGQNVFKDVLAARKRTVTQLNNILGKVLVSDTRREPSILNGADGKSPYLHWSKAQGSYFIEPVPAKALWKNKFNSLASLLNDAVVPLDNDLMAMLRNENEYWSVMNPGEWDATDQSADSGWDESVWDLEPTKLYQYKVGSLATLKHWQKVLKGLTVDASVPVVQNGDRIIVDNDINSETGGLWTLWEMQSNQFHLVCTQKYNSKDAWTYADWYDTGLTALDEPVNKYATLAQRNSALGNDNPKLTFVKVMDDGKGNWIWTRYVDGGWKIVAKQNGTIQLSDNIWKHYGNYLEQNNNQLNKELMSFDAAAFAQMAKTRDLGYELNKVLNALRETILTDIEVNELFFGWVNYAHTEQDFIDWCFKTSFMYVTGYNDKLRQDPISFADLTGNLLDYINEVKPYHVKVRDFISKYGLDDAVANVRAMDFDKPAYYDSVLGRMRILNHKNITDLKIIQEGVWINWYNQLTFTENDKVRKLNISMNYAEETSVKVTEELTINVFRQDGTVDDVEYGWGIMEWDGHTVYDFDETISTQDYMQERFIDVSVYDSEEWDEFAWDMPLETPRVIAERVEDGVSSTDQAVMDVMLTNDHATQPAFTIHIDVNSNEGEWKKTSMASGFNMPL